MAKPTHEAHASYHKDRRGSRPEELAISREYHSLNEKSKQKMAKHMAYQHSLVKRSDKRRRNDHEKCENTWNRDRIRQIHRQVVGPYQIDEADYREEPEEPEELNFEPDWSDDPEWTQGFDSK
ncbi:MAG: hypothetical protein MMC33_005306 [Icmadophila ericetorum]|nr:hypothetical protein [Icmadophila ericetorum]